jgi:hypothetical protein
MKKLVDGLPFVLLLVLTPFLFYKDPNIAQSIIIAAISALVGYRYYLEHKAEPNYRKEFKEEIEKLQKEFKEFRDNYGKMAMSGKTKRESARESIRW